MTTLMKKSKVPFVIDNEEHNESRKINADRKPWKRFLWLKQDYPDTYTDPDFINYIDNLDLTKFDYSYDRIRSDFLKFYYIILNTCFLFITFSLIYHYNYDPKPLSIGSTVLVLISSFFIKNEKQENKIMKRQVKSGFIITFTALTLSPVLKSLSTTTSTDSIWMISFWLTIYYLFSIFKSMTGKTTKVRRRKPRDSRKMEGSKVSSSKNHTNMHHKSIEKPAQPVTYSKNLPTNILLANIAMLSSRLDSSTSVFCFLLICVQINIILPNMINLSNIFVSLMSNLIVYTFINLTLGFSSMIIFGIFTLLYINCLPRLFWYWEMNYKCKKPELLFLWDNRTPILE